MSRKLAVPEEIGCRLTWRRKKLEQFLIGRASLKCSGRRSQNLDEKVAQRRT
jgi:hypothetical protein